MATYELTPPKDPYGYVPKYFRTRSIPALPANRRYALTPSYNRPDSDWLSNGVTHISLNQGRTDISTVPYNRRAGFVECDFIKNASGGVPVNQMSDDALKNAVDSFVNPRDGGYGLWTSGMQEAYGANIPWGVENGTSYAQVIHKRIAEKCTALGGNYHAGYDGHLNIIAATSDFTSNEVLRNKFTNQTEALNFCKANSGFGNPYFTQEEWQWRDALLNLYWAGPLDPGRRSNMFLAMQAIHTKAQQATGVSRRLLSFLFGVKTEFAGPGIQFNAPVEGGVWKSAGFPTLSFTVELAISFYSFLFGDVFIWEESQRHGDNIGIIKPNFYENGQLIEYYEGTGNPQRKGTNTQYDPSGLPYFSRPFGYMDSSAIAAEYYALCVAWAGQNWMFTRNKKSNVGSFPAMTDGYIIDQQANQRPISVMGQTNSKRWIFFYDGQSTGVWSDYDIDILAGTPFSKTLCSGIPYLFFLNGLTEVN